MDPDFDEYWRNLSLFKTFIYIMESIMGLLPDTQICGLRMRRERFPRHPLQTNSLVIDPGMHHGTCVAD